IQYASALIAALEKAEQFGMGAQRYSFRLFRIINILEQRVLWQTKMYSMAEINAKKLSCLKLGNCYRSSCEIADATSNSARWEIVNAYFI
ncbi:hypothetical protein CLONEX_02505, partial [[Clostridium] nexile DSM 1787]